MAKHKKMVELFRRDHRGSIIPCGRLEIELAVEAGYKNMEVESNGMD